MDCDNKELVAAAENLATKKSRNQLTTKDVIKNILYGIAFYLKNEEPEGPHQCCDGIKGMMKDDLDDLIDELVISTKTETLKVSGKWTPLNHPHIDTVMFMRLAKSNTFTNCRAREADLEAENEAQAGQIQRLGGNANVQNFLNKRNKTSMKKLKKLTKYALMGLAGYLCILSLALIYVM